MKNKITFLHLFLLNHFVLTLIVLGVIGAYGTYVINIEQRAIKERFEPILAREADRLKTDFQSIESSVQKLKNILEMFEYMPMDLRVKNFKLFASETLAPYPIQYNAFVALGPRLSRKYFHRDSFVLTVHRNPSLEGSPQYLEASSFLAEEFKEPGYDKDPNMQWWAMNENSPGLNFSDFYFDKGYMEKVMFTSGMGLYRGGELEAVVGVDTLTGEIAARLSSFHLGETGGLFVADENGRPVLPLLNKDVPALGYKYIKATSLSQFKALSSVSAQSVSVAGGQIRDIAGLDGEEYITFARPLKMKGRSWNLVVYQKKSEAYAGLYGRLLILSAAIFLVYLVVSGMLYITGRYVIRREKKAFEELRKSRDTAEAATKAKSTFLSTMSHEIRTPLNAMLGSADLLQETTLSKEQHDYLNSLIGAGESLLAVLNDVLDFSKIEAGKMQLESRDFLLSELVRDIELLVMPSVYRKKLQFHVHYPVIDFEINGDDLRMKQVLLNLLGNSVKFTDQGSISLSVRVEALGGDHQKRIVFEVSDTGVGIAAENIDKVFNEFSQEDSSVTRRFGGTGLGLSISKKIVEMMNGKIFCRSIQHQGSTFTFYVDLPAKSVGAWVQKVESYQTFPSQNSLLTAEIEGVHKSILLVDDMEDNHLLMRAYLKSIPGIEIDSAFNGEECLKKIQIKEYSLIVMDMQMPVLSGLDTILRLREMEQKEGRCRVPVIVVSANNFTEDREKSLSVGADEHCGKPLRKKTLVELVGKYCLGEDDNMTIG